MSDLFGSDFFKGNRERLRQLFTGTAPIVITAHGRMQKIADEAFAFRQDQVLPLGPVVIQEIMYHPVSGETEPAEMEFVELYNASATGVALFDTSFPTNTCKLGGAVEFTFPTNTVLPAYQTLLVVSFNPVANPALLEAFRSQYGLANTVSVYGPFAGRLSNDAGTVVLYRPEPEIDLGGMTAWTPLDRVTYSAAAPWPAEADGAEAAKNPEVAKKFSAFGFESTGRGGAVWGREMDEQLKVYSDLALKAGIKPQ